MTTKPLDLYSLQPVSQCFMYGIKDAESGFYVSYTYMFAILSR